MKTPLSRLSMGAGFNEYEKYEEEEVYIRKKVVPQN